MASAMKAVLLGVALSFLTLLPHGHAAEARPDKKLTVAELPLQDVIRFDDQVLVNAEEVDVALPPLTPRPNMVTVLRFRAVSYNPTPGGWNFNAKFSLNGNALERHTSAGDPRLIGRDAVYHARGRDWQLFSGFMIRTMYAPDADTGDAMIPDGQGASFAFNISDVARGVDGNLLRLSNMRRTASTDPDRDLIVTDIEVGWLDKSLLPKLPDRTPKRAAIGGAVSRDGLSLAQAAGGGFTLVGPGGVELLVETGLSADRQAESQLIAEDAESNGVEVRTTDEAGEADFELRAAWANGVVLERALQIRDGLLHWTETWTNTGDAVVGLPYQQRVFLRDELSSFRLGGDSTINHLASSATNPTVYLGSKEKLGSGFGVTLESDWLRLLSGLRQSGGLGEVYSLHASLQPGDSIDFVYTVTPVEDGGYWTFINRVRERWGVNGGTAERPFFWNWAGRQGRMTPEAWQKAFGHLGKIAVSSWQTTHPWMRMGYDLHLLETGQYPRLSPGAPRTPGTMADLDVDAYLTFAHREPYWADYTARVEVLREALPDAQLVHMTHPGIEAVYLPLADRWPHDGEALRGPDGELFNSPHYTRAFLGETAAKGWQMTYNVPRDGSPYQSITLRDVERSLDEANGDGVYVDEFSWEGPTRGYSRYDYAQSDGYSADLDERGNVVRLKSDNAYTSEATQLKMFRAARERGKYFIANGNAALRSVNELRALRFREGGNGVGAWAGAHLATVPLILGNFGDQGTTRRGVFQSVKAVIENGCVYSPKECNLVLDGPDNFVSKQYPITVQALGPGVIKAEERLIATRSGAYAWPGRAVEVTLYRYDKNGDLMDRNHLPRVDIGADGVLDVAVPADGMVIAEVND